MNKFEREEQRYEYPLNEDSVVLDVGAYEGTFAREIVRRYNCYVLMFEPIREYARKLHVLESEKVRVYDIALGAEDRRNVPMAKCKDWSSIHRMDVEAVDIELVDVKDVRAIFDSLRSTGAAGAVDLMKINIEGGEYDLLDRMLECDLLHRVKHLQVQFHEVGAGRLGAEVRRQSILGRLAVTHELEWCTPFVWESWRRA